MRWTKVRELVEERFAPSVAGRVRFHSTRYGQCSCGRGWITIDGREIADLNTLLAWPRFGSVERPLNAHGHPVISDAARASGVVAEPGEFTRAHLHEACWEFLHSSLNASVASTNPLVKALAVLDARVGAQRLERIQSECLHPLTRAVLEFRRQADAERKVSHPTGKPA
ncbi:MAG: hypothetical protein KC766_23650 [Myxococcales bacterium]|nr:hypothetical protein [Myxococcales bacterium]